MEFNNIVKKYNTDKYMYSLPYECEFSAKRNDTITLLELGAYKGESLKLWNEYFTNGRIYSIDIDPRFEQENVFIGKQEDENFLNDVISRIGNPDIIIDDGSHIVSHQQKSFEVLFPLLKDGGVYIIEDLCTSYWKDHVLHFVDGLDTISYIRGLFDEVNDYGRDPHDIEIKTKIKAIKMYRSIVFIEKYGTPITT